MQSKSDAQLLSEYAERGSEAAFAEIVTRHADLVHSAALRQVDSPDLARDVAQRIFSDLARKAKPVSCKLSPESSLVGWLYRSTRFAALNVRREEHRRQARERQAMEQFNPTDDSPAWEQIRPLLDEGMEELSDADRDALLLRFFKNQDLRAVGVALGISDDAAQKRVTRAVERLRGFFARRGVAVAAGGLTLAISANAVQAAPAGLAVTLSTAAVLAGAAVQSATTLAVTQTIAMTTLQKALVAATLFAAVGTATYEAHQTSSLRTEAKTAHQQQAAFASQVAQLTRERDEAAGKLGALGSENERLNRNNAELLKLRGEAVRLRQDSKELAALKARTLGDQSVTLVNAWLQRVERLKQRLQQNPEASIPELKSLTQEEWLSYSRADLKTEADFQAALSGLRSYAEIKYAQRMVPAVTKYAQEHGGQLPADLLQIKSSFEPPIEDAILRRYDIVPAASLPTLSMQSREGLPTVTPQDLESWVITQKAPVDMEHDSCVAVGPSVFGYGSFEQSEMTKTLMPALKAFAAANNGGKPTEVSQLEPYATTPEQQAALQKYQKMYEVEGPINRARDKKFLERLQVK